MVAEQVAEICDDSDNIIIFFEYPVKVTGNESCIGRCGNRLGQLFYDDGCKAQANLPISIENVNYKDSKSKD